MYKRQLHITQYAYVDNFGTNGEVRYYASAIDEEGEEYQITWETSEEFNQSQELHTLIEELNQLTSQKTFDDGVIARIEDLENEIEKLESKGINSSYCEDESNACNWDEADYIEQI